MQSTGHRAPDWRPENQKVNALAPLFSLHHLTSTNPTPPAYHLQRCRRQLFTRSFHQSILHLQRWPLRQPHYTLTEIDPPIDTQPPKVDMRHPNYKRQSSDRRVCKGVLEYIIPRTYDVRTLIKHTCAHLYGTCYTLLTHCTATRSSSSMSTLLHHSHSSIAHLS